jgi:hypothetical protein
MPRTKQIFEQRAQIGDPSPGGSGHVDVDSNMTQFGAESINETDLIDGHAG